MKNTYATETEIRTASLIARRTIAQRRYAAAVCPEGSAAEVQDAAELRVSIEAELIALIGTAAYGLMKAEDALNGVTAQGYATTTPVPQPPSTDFLTASVILAPGVKPRLRDVQDSWGTPMHLTRVKIKDRGQGYQEFVAYYRPR